MKNKFAVISTWPGAVCAEKEVFERLKIAAKELGKECYIISEDGYILDEHQNLTKTKIDTNEIDFIISSHFRDSKKLDAFYYHPLWNPPDFLLNDNDYSTFIDNYIQNDDFLIYGKGAMLNHLKSILLNSPRDLEGASLFVASFPESIIKPPAEKFYQIFYCGINWEVLFNKGQGRHAGLFEKLDNSGCIRIFGPNKIKEWKNKRPWKGYKSYEGEIPFDGVSMLNKINECGIVLCLSSDLHRKTGAASSRIYEAIAGGAIIISDDNPFVKEHFSDAALFINFNKYDIEDTYRQIMEKYQWIQENPKKVKEIILKAQDIFKTKFSMNKTITNIYLNHENRKKAVSKMLFAQNNNEKISIIYNLEAKTLDEKVQNKLKNVIKNITNQIYKNVELVILCDESIQNNINNYINNNILFPIKIIGSKIYNLTGTKIISFGKQFYNALNDIKSDYYIIINDSEIWYKDHLITLKRQLEDNQNVDIAYSGVIQSFNENALSQVIFKLISNQEIYNFDAVCSNGQFLFRNNNCQNYYEFTFDYIDELLVHYLIFNSVFKDKKILVFSKRNTIYIKKYYEDEVKSYDIIKQKRYIIDLFKYSYINKISDNKFLYLSNFQDRLRKIIRTFVKLELLFYEFIQFFILFGKKRDKNKKFISMLRKDNKDLIKMRK